MKYLFFLFFLAAGTFSAMGQFTVPRSVERQNGIDVRVDSVRRVAVAERPDSLVSGPARERARKLALRKERNTTEFNAKLSASQTQFNNWASGGENAFNALSSIFFKHQYKRKGFGLESRVDAKYGMNYIDKRAFKNQDVFQINELITWSAAKFWSWSVDAELRSQFAKGDRSRTDRTKISNFMSPGTMKIAAGLVYRHEPWTVNLSPVGGSATFVMDDDLTPLGLSGVPKNRHSKWQVGPSVRIIYDNKFAKDAVRLYSELYSFTNIRKTPTVRWETKCEIKATKYLSTTLNWLVQYDKDANTRKRDHVQSQHSIAVGLSYTFKNK